MAVLLAAEHVAGAAKFQVERSDAEARAELAEFFHRRQALASDVGKRCVRRNEQISVGALMRSPDASAQLIKLGEAEAVGAIDENRVRARNVEAVFHDRGCDQHVGFVADELQHHGFEFFFAQSDRGPRRRGLLARASARGLQASRWIRRDCG